METIKPSLTVVAVGDLVFNHMAPQGEIHPFENVAPILRKADLAFANLENPLTTRGVRTLGKTAEALRAHQQDVMRGSPAFAGPMAAAGFDVVSVANNHSMDFSAVGLSDTLHALDA